MKSDGEADMGILLSRYIDNELSDEERKRVDEHVAECRECRGTLEIFRRNEELLKGSLSVETFGNEVVEHVMGKISSEEPVTTRIYRIFRRIPRPAWGGLAAALAIAILLTVVIAQSAVLLNLSQRIAKFEPALQQTESERGILTDLCRRLSDLAAESEMRGIEQQGKSSRLAAVPRGNRIHLRMNFGDLKPDHFEVYRRPKGSDAGWGTPRRTSETDLFDVVAPNTMFEYRVVARGSNDSELQEATVKVRSGAESMPLDRGNAQEYLRVTVLQSDEKAATISVERTVDGVPHTRAYQVRAGQEVGGLHMDLASPSTFDLRTGYVLQSMSEEERTLIVTSDGNAVSRPTWKVVLRPKSGHGDPVECWAGSDVLLRPVP